MRGYYPRVSLEILPDSGDEPPPVLSRGQRDPDVNRNDKDGTWLAEAASVLWSMRPPMLGSTGPRVQHTTWLREQMWEFLRSRAPARVVSPSTRSGTNSHTFTVSILQSLVTCSYFVLAPSLAVSFPPPFPANHPHSPLLPPLRRPRQCARDNQYRAAPTHAATPCTAPRPGQAAALLNLETHSGQGYIPLGYHRLLQFGRAVLQIASNRGAAPFISRPFTGRILKLEGLTLLRTSITFGSVL